jgi:hypothetical protein
MSSSSQKTSTNEAEVDLELELALEFSKSVYHFKWLKITFTCLERRIWKNRNSGNENSPKMTS